MLVPTVLALSALSGLASSTLAPNFPLSGGTTDLNLTFGTNNVSPPGELIPRADTVNPPNITSPVWTSAGRGVVLIVDTDVPRNNTRLQLLHYLASNVTLSRDNKTLVLPPVASTEASYRQPSPPAGDIAHAYTVLLFTQPSNFSIPSAFRQVLIDRAPFNVSAFALATGLGNPLAANYFRVQNTTGTATTTFPPPASTPTNGTSGRPSASPFRGAATVDVTTQLEVLHRGSSKIYRGGTSGRDISGR
ncbi:PEBP-like protein [Periconia macrospinosa]|uniref:PEBP-like protein n=1 Tax=Periconia macrospinosa TaxID=97972 RepID=A0A2V1DEY7_9PLEO|nr:PEBP-like protein [Periconia macrospinosa]